MDKTDAEKFEAVIAELRAVKIPICSTVEGIALTVNLEGWIEQLIERIGTIAR